MRRFLPVVAMLAMTAATALLAQDTEQRKGFSIAITEPENQAIVFGKTRLAATVKVDRPEMVDRVDFLIGDDVIFVDREAPYECLYDFGEETRSFIVRAVAYHKEGVSVSDVAITRRLAFSTIERVSRVILWLTATDKEGHLITDLTRDDFRVYEGDEEQTIIDFYAENRPITLAILIDTSGSMQGKIEEVHDAAGAFVDTLQDQDQALIIDFDDKVFLIQDLTSDKDALKEAITSTEPIGGTALYDALHAAYRKIGEIEGRKAIILLSDGEDTSSLFGFERVLEEAQTNNTMIFSIGLGIEGAAPRRDILKEFSETTGGRFFHVKKVGKLVGAYERIAEELRTQYYLTYSTTNEEWDGHWIKIRLESELPGVNIRARRGYFAVRKEPAAD
jgi:Ca-activated chloride channel family protein